MTLEQKWIQKIRNFARDHPQLNRIIDGTESSDQQILDAINLAIAEFNATPPLIRTYELKDFPDENLLIGGTLLKLLDSVGFLDARNEIAYTDTGGIQVRSGKFTQQQNLRNRLFAEYYTKLRAYKIALNINNALGVTGIPSQYSILSTWR